MKSLSSQLIELLSSEFPVALPTRNILLFSPPHHFAHGLLLERTSYSRSFYVWELIVPLFNPMKSLSLNYSHRISISKDNRFLLSVQKGGEKVASANISDAFRAQSDKKIIDNSDLQGFLRKFPMQASPKRQNVVLDYAVAYCLVGDVGHAMKLFKSLQTSILQDDFSKNISRQASIYIDCIISHGESALLGILKINELDNIGRHFPELQY